MHLTPSFETLVSVWAEIRNPSSLNSLLW